jgi:hypothetical protein
LEGFLVSDDAIYPSLTSDRRSVEFADRFAHAAAEARAVVNGPWHIPPGPDDQMHADATGRHVITVVLAERS